jgi:membrane protease YdiL (CAAX protease family)
MRWKPLQRILLYTALILLCGLIGRFLEWDNISGQPGIGQGLWILSPVLIALVFKYVFKTSWQDWALKPALRSNWRNYLVATFLYPFMTFFVVFVGLVLQYSYFPEGLSKGFSLVLTQTLAAIVPMFVKNIFEEVAWRGYLTGEVEKLDWQRWQQLGLVGLIWAAWHFPFLDVLLKTYSTESIWTFLPRFIIFIVSASFIYGTLRQLTKSVWVAVWLHTVANAVAAAFFMPNIFIIQPDKAYLIAPSGDSWLFIVINLIFAWYFYKQKANFSEQ